MKALVFVAAFAPDPNEPLKAVGAKFPAPRGAGWKTIPSWYIVAKNDKAINPDAERFYAKRANAKTTEVESSHVVFLSHPDAVVGVIVDAATAAAKR